MRQATFLAGPSDVKYNNFESLVGGGIAQWIAFGLLDPAAPGSIPGVYSLIVDVADVYRRHCCLEQWTAEA